MVRPDSLTARAARRLVHWIERRVWPPPGEAWCIGCPRNGGRTLIIPADAVDHHLAQHPDGEWVRLQITETTVRGQWP